VPEGPKQFATLRARRSSAGFTLVELVVTVVIITILSAIALPSLRRGMRDRRTRQAAEEIARVYRDARLRAIGRGSAVMVRYNSESHSFVVREAITGSAPGSPNTCAQLPATSCQLANFAANANVLRGSQPIETVTLDESPERTGLKVQLELPSSGATAIDEYSVCFTPLGRSFASTTWPPVFSAFLSQVPIVRVWRTEVGQTERVGLERRVVLLPNGQARLQTAGGGT
jgi:type IV fimbrial biogenesis protein FimT